MASFDFNEVFSALDQDGDGFIIANDVKLFKKDVVDRKRFLSVGSNVLLKISSVL